MPANKRYDAALKLTSAIEVVAEGPAKTPAKLTREFLEALTCFAATMTGNTSVIVNSDTNVNEYMFIYHK